MISKILHVKSERLAEICESLTGWGRVVNITPDGVITWEIEGESEFELGRRSYDVEKELQSYECRITITVPKLVGGRR